MSVERVRELAEPASKTNLFNRVKEVEVAGERYRIKRLTRREMFESGISWLSWYLISLDRELNRESNLERKKEIVRERERAQYEFERKMLLASVEDMTEEKLDELDVDTWRELLNHVVEWNFLRRDRLSPRHESREDLIPGIS